MALQKQTLELPLISGIDTKTDPKQVKVGKLLVAENTTFVKPGRIQKREGFTAAGQGIIGTGEEITDGQAVMSFKDELICFDQNNIYSYVQATDNWKDKGDFQSIYLTSNPVSNGTAKDFAMDCAFHPSGLECYVFMRSEGGQTNVYYEVFDSATGQLIVGPVLAAAATGFDPRVQAFNDTFVIVYRDTSDNRLYKGVLPIGNLATVVTFGYITEIHTNSISVSSLYPAYDILTATSGGVESLYVAFSNRETTPSAGITLFQFADPADSNPINQFVIANQQMLQGQLFAAENSTIGLVYKAFSPFNIELYNFDADLSAQNYNASLAAPAGANPVQSVTAVAKSTTQASIDIYISYLAAGGFQKLLKANYNGSTINTEWTKNQIAAAGEAFLYAGKSYLPVIGGPDITTADQLKTCFLIDANGAVNARFLYEVSTGINAEVATFFWTLYYLPSILKVSDTEFITAFRNITEFGSVGGTEQTGITKVKFDFYEPEKSYSRAEIGESLYVGGGMLYQYDGQNLVEDNFNWKCEIAAANGTVGGVGNSYSYVSVWEWVDKNGNLHRSAVGQPKTVTTGTPLGTGGSATTLQIYPLSLTEKTSANDRSSVVAVVYRTKANSDIYYKLPVTNANYNNINANYITPVNDTTPDSQLVEPLYTTGEVLDNDPPPPIGGLVVYRNRLFAIDSTNPLQIWYSKTVRYGVPVEWSGFQTINIDPSGGPVTGIAALDDKLIIFKRSQIRFISGQGPDNTGANNDFDGGSIFITADAGCTNLRSIVNTPEGLVFKSSKGIYIINRGLSVQYIGAAVEEFNGAFITSAILMAQNNQIRLTTDNNIALVYDYYVDAWCVFKPLNAVDSVIWNGKQSYIRSNGQIMNEASGIYTDNGSFYPMKITTSWLNLSGIQGFERIYKFYVLGQYKSAHQLQIKLSYDYNNATYQTITVDPVVPSYYGGSPYGTGSYGGNYTPYQYEIRPQRQKCMNMRVTISELPVSGSLLEGVQISNLRFEYGVEGGGNRVRDRQVAGN